MSEATFRFHHDLDRFLPQKQHGQALSFRLNGRTAIKHPIESFGVPHTEVGLITVHGEAVGFGYLLQPQDEVRVFPPRHGQDTAAEGLLRPPLPHPVRFLLDVHLGQLATYLRLLGFDALYRNDYDDETLAALSEASGRVLLTRDRRLLMRKQITYGYCLHTRDPREQVQAVLQRYALLDAVDPWQRCLRCNGLLQAVEKAAVLSQLEPKTRLYYDAFHRCQSCGKIYWKGSHYPRMQRFIRRIIQDSSRATDHGAVHGAVHEETHE